MKIDHNYPKHSIGQHIVPFALTFEKNETAERVLAKIRGKAGSWPNAEEIFVLDPNKKLIGALDFNKLLSAPLQEKLESLMRRDFVSLTDHSHQDSAAKLAVKMDLESIPVTDRGGRFLGIVDAGQIFKIMHEEHVEKLMHFSGILDNEAFLTGYKAKILTSVKSRFPWLFLGLIGGILSTILVERFSHTLETKLALAFFIPVIVYMNAAVGTQTQTIFVRYSFLERIGFRKSLFYEIRVAATVGVILSLTIFTFTALWLDAHLAIIVSLSMFFGILSSALIGTLIPWFLQKAGKDPAIGSGPFTTIIQDLLSISIYFTIASALL